MKSLNKWDIINFRSKDGAKLLLFYLYAHCMILFIRSRLKIYKWAHLTEN